MTGPGRPATDVVPGPVALWLAGPARGRVGHAYLLVGGTPETRVDVARRFAAAALCGRPGEAGGCGGCASCRKVAAGSHPDLLWVAPATGRSGIESLKREAIADLVARTWLRPVEAARKLAVVQGTELLTAEAGNTLLKTLEEPPGEVVFCLLADHAGAVLPTLASRCRPVRMPPAAAAPDPRAEEAAAELERTLETADEHALLSLSAAWDQSRPLALATIDAFARRLRESLGQALGLEPGPTARSPERLLVALSATLRVRSQLERNANFRLAVDAWLLALRPVHATGIIN